jgi:formate dehydrogenase
VSETHHTFCRICEALCGLEVKVEDGEIAEIRPDPEHVGTRGYVCVKGIKQQGLYRSPDRLTQPLKRVGSNFEAITWAQALAEIGAKVRSLRGERGADSIGMYVGTAAGFSTLHPIFAQGFMQGLGSTSLYSTATQDCANKFAVARHVYGFPFTQPFPDLDRTRFLVVVGANPAVSKWSFGQVSNPLKRLKAIRERGGQVVVVDPRRTETARAASRHIFVRPDSDVFFYLAFLHEVLRRKLFDPARVETHTTGFDELWKVVEPWTPERCGEVTDIDPATLIDLVEGYCAADGAALYSSTGVNMGSNGALSFWLQEVINAITGNLDRAGGTLVGEGIFDFARFSVRRGLLMSQARSRVGGLPAVNDAFAGGVLADEILSPGEGQLRALFVTGGNPLITMPNSGRLREAFRALELMVCVDIFLNETASEAHYVLPAVSPFQRPDLPFVFPLFLGMQTRPYLQATRALLPPTGEQRDEASIYLDLAAASGVGLFGSRILQGLLRGLQRWHGRRNGGSQPSLPQEGILNLILRLTGQPSFRALLGHEHGLALGAERAGTFLNQRLVTEDGKVHLAPLALLERARGLGASWTALKASRDQLRLITKRALRTHNSWTHNLDEFVAGERSSNFLYMHPDDARKRGLSEGALVDVRSSVATVRLPMRLLDDLMPGVVALPHGWGHQHAKGLSVASRTTGVNVNLLAADGPDNLDPLSGMAQLTGIVVEVQAAAGALEPGSWSGLPDDEEGAGLARALTG